LSGRQRVYRLTAENETVLFIQERANEHSIGNMSIWNVECLSSTEAGSKHIVHYWRGWRM